MERRWIAVPAGGARLEGELVLPKRPRGLVVLAHAGGRLDEKGMSVSGRSQHLGARLNHSGFGTLALDVRTPSEEVRAWKSGVVSLPDLELGRDRLTGVVASLGRHPATDDLRMGLVAWGPVGASALQAAADLPQAIRSLVVGGGQLELTRDVLHRVRAATLIVLGEEDEVERLADTRMLAGALGGPQEVELVGRANHLFDSPEAMEELARRTLGWFEWHLAMHRPGFDPRPEHPA